MNVVADNVNAIVPDEDVEPADIAETIDRQILNTPEMNPPVPFCEDHTVGNLSYLMEYAKELDGLKERVILDGINVRPELYIDMVSDWTTAFAITDSCSLHVGEGREISIFSADNTLKIKSEGLTWKTDDVVFDNWWKATLNKAYADEVRLTLSHPSAVLIILN